MGPESFEEVRAQGDAALRALLAQGRSAQRIWALWVLAARVAGIVGQVKEPEPELGDSYDYEDEDDYEDDYDDDEASAEDAAAEDAATGGSADPPTVTTRCAYAAALAERCEVGLLTGLVRHDPSAVVRATAIRHVARLAAGAPGDEGGVALRVAFEGAKQPAMRTAILGGLGEGAPAPLIELAVRALEAASLHVQLAALAALVRIDTPDTLAHAARWMRRLSDPSVAFDAWIGAVDELVDPARRADSLGVLARMHAGAPAAVRAELLRQLAAPPWFAVAPLIEGSDELLRFLCRRRDVAFPARVLAGAILRGLHDGCAERLAADLGRAAHARALLAELRRACTLDDARPLLAGLTERAGELGRAGKIAGAGEVLAELAGLHPVERLIGLENVVARWLPDDELGDARAPLCAYCERHLASLPAVPPIPAPPDDLAAYAAAPPPTERAIFEALLAALRAAAP